MSNLPITIGNPRELVQKIGLEYFGVGKALLEDFWVECALFYMGRRREVRHPFEHYELHSCS